MRVLPAGWGDPYAKVQKAPTAYLRILGSAWPPASVVNGESLPTGTTVVNEWSFDIDLDAPLLPGQINTDPKIKVGEAKCTIPQPKGGHLAPWRSGAERTPEAGQCELVLSLDGHNGSTAFVLGRFALNPISGRLSAPTVTVTMKQDLARLQRDHTIPTRQPGVGGWANSLQILAHAAASSGFALAATGGFLTGVDFCYFPRRTDQLVAMQQVVAANLAAMFLTSDGTTLRVLDPNYLRGTGTVLETLQVMGSFEDLVWSQDPNATVDRIEVTYVPPRVTDGPIGPEPPWDTGAIWTAPKGAGIPAGGTYSFEFDPGSFIAPAFSGVDSFPIMVNQRWDGGGSESSLIGTITELSSGNWSVSIPNPTSTGKYLVLPWDRPPHMEDGELVVGLDRGWDVPKGTPSYIPGAQDQASESEGARTLAWGAAADDASNTLSFNLGRLVQHDAYAAEIFNRVVARVTSPTFVVENARVVPNIGRELGDLYRVREPGVGLDQRALVTGIHMSGKAADESGQGAELNQSLSLAMLPLVPGD